MGTHPQSLTEATLLSGIGDAPQVQSVGLGVTVDALEDFSNFVQHIATNVVQTSDGTAAEQPNHPQPRRSSRFLTRQEGVAPSPLTRPAPPQQAVRSLNHACHATMDPN